jgi:hypothetical protein
MSGAVSGIVRFLSISLSRPPLSRTVAAPSTAAAARH